ncbi:unnamed protein product, partial [marine sediment metagenome]
GLNSPFQWEAPDNTLDLAMGYSSINHQRYIPNYGRKAWYWLEYFMTYGKGQKRRQIDFK